MRCLLLSNCIYLQQSINYKFIFNGVCYFQIVSIFNWYTFLAQPIDGCLLLSNCIYLQLCIHNNDSKRKVFVTFKLYLSSTKIGRVNFSTGVCYFQIVSIFNIPPDNLLNFRFFYRNK